VKAQGVTGVTDAADRIMQFSFAEENCSENF
jgi:hypothetical protein